VVVVVRGARDMVEPMEARLRLFLSMKEGRAMLPLRLIVTPSSWQSWRARQALWRRAGQWRQR